MSESTVRRLKNLLSTKKMNDRFGELRALSDATRFRIALGLHHLGGMTAEDIAKATGRSASLVSRHLRDMERRGIVAARKAGSEVMYMMRPHRLQHVLGL